MYYMSCFSPKQSEKTGFFPAMAVQLLHQPQQKQPQSPQLQQQHHQQPVAASTHHPIKTTSVSSMASSISSTETCKFSIYLFATFLKAFSCTVAMGFICSRSRPPFRLTIFAKT